MSISILTESNNVRKDLLEDTLHLTKPRETDGTESFSSSLNNEIIVTVLGAGALLRFTFHKDCTSVFGFMYEENEYSAHIRKHQNGKISFALIPGIKNENEIIPLELLRFFNEVWRRGFIEAANDFVEKLFNEVFKDKKLLESSLSSYLQKGIKFIVPQGGWAEVKENVLRDPVGEYIPVRLPYINTKFMVIFYRHNFSCLGRIKDHPQGSLPFECGDLLLDVPEKVWVEIISEQIISKAEDIVTLP